MKTIGHERFHEINQNLASRIEQKKSLVASHRGVWGGNVAENTALAYKIAIELGADMYEMDLSLSTDGEVYVFHDGGEKRLFGFKENIQTLSSLEIDKLTFSNSIAHDTCRHVERFSEVLDTFRGDELFNLDRSWTLLDKAEAVLRDFPHAQRQMVWKTHVKKDYLNFFENCQTKYMYMPIVFSMDDINTVLSYKNINTVGFELIAQTPQSELFSRDVVDYLRERNMFAWANAITLSAEKRHILFGGLDDDLALLEGPEASWGKILEMGVEVVQTDWPVQLSRYRDKFFALA